MQSNQDISAEPINKKKQLQEYDQQMIQLFQDQVNDGILEIYNNQEITNLDFIQNLYLYKLQLNKCYNIEQNITNDTIKELTFDRCGFQNVLGLKLNNLEILCLREEQIDDTQNILIKMSTSPYFSKLREFELSGHLSQNDIEMSGQLSTKQLKDKSLSNLVKLTLENNDITNTDVISQLINLEELDLSRNMYINISPIQYLTKLTKLSLESCELTDIQDLSKLPKLIDLNLSLNEGIDISPLSHLTQLVRLDLYCCSLVGIPQQLENSELDYPQFLDNSINKLSLLSSLINLKDLYISSNNIDDINPLYQLVKLTILNISYSKVKDFSVLRKLTNLEVLNMSFNSNADITPLQYLVKLRKLELWHCNLYDIYALRPLINLQKLILSNNFIHDISPLCSLNNLIELYLNENIITDFSSVKQHINLHQFQIEDQIKDQYMPTIKEQKIYKKIQIIDTSTILLRNTSQRRKQINARVNLIKEQISQCLFNLNNNHLQFSRNVISIFQQLDTGESCQ
ncbi:Conserved_hypothetical protein [Hexamita inflata]|uniref:Uncharacterized protein n=1 Tax=Hexamita inflata TaxID=28002 RepID=A0AA86Q340_9EUKA|nr:Conserved hypothetical protein [Hexamita inflata]